MKRSDRKKRAMWLAVLDAAGVLGGGVATSFSDDFNRADGAAGNGWSGGDIVSNQLVITPTESAELLTNGDFSAWTADDPDGWTVTGESGSDPAVSEVGSGEDHTGTGTGSANFYTTVTSRQPEVAQTIGSTQWVVIRYDRSFNDGRFFGVDGISLSRGGGVIELTHHSIETLTLIPGGAPVDTTIDSVSLKQLAGYFAHREQHIANAYAQVDLTHQSDLNAGIVQYFDDSNYVVAYYFSSVFGAKQIRLLKCVGGVMTIVSTVTISAATSPPLRMTRSGTSYSVSYNGSEVISGATISDAVFDNATKWGLFSADASYAFDNYEWGAV